VESARGSIAGWALIAFGLAYFIWGLRAVWKNKPHEHVHPHLGADTHTHPHTHHGRHAHVHDIEGKANITPWILFTIFVLGPCEPLIPLLMYPAAKQSLLGLVLVVLVFGAITVATMLAVVLLSSAGVNMLPLEKLERYSHALAGAAILASGLAIQFLGL
jgi:sulfite exporter TauE/SafE